MPGWSPWPASAGSARPGWRCRPARRRPTATPTAFSWSSCHRCAIPACWRPPWPAASACPPRTTGRSWRPSSTTCATARCCSSSTPASTWSTRAPRWRTRCARHPASPCWRPAGSRSASPGECTFLLRPLPVPAPDEPARARRGLRRGRAVRAARRRGRRRVHRHRRQPRGRHRALPRARRHPAGDRAGRGAAAGAAAGRDGQAPRRPLPGAHRGQAGRGGAAPHASRGDRVELRAVHAGRAAAVGAAVGVRRDLRPRRRRRGVRGRRAGPREDRRDAGRPGGEVRSCPRRPGRSGSAAGGRHRSTGCSTPSASSARTTWPAPTPRRSRRTVWSRITSPWRSGSAATRCAISSRSTARSTASTPTCGRPWSTRST